MTGVIKRQLDEIQDKDAFIKWLVNMYFVQSLKLETESQGNVAEIERQQVKSKADEFLKEAKND
ncbi:hypothetical protein QI302_02320 [Staphylococcus saprophyticus]|uniref:hypothetical protein n=1 Tax=Staphylococcus equorum TaxID=246432 RepID=UPI0008FB32F4|nr:hypothetical protein [Staphylococcus equorum]MDW3926455.1 hypothetical protein [Staphylococcus saprophyticus]MDW4219843.1 hypothetical protein [Staphylococcus saprophyticus]MDW4338251.1 hypothetical protein [Staphylococcus saprophyticus]OIS50208.1 hypothetical protein A4A29_02310 [Staphylococcus equorum]